MSIHRISAKIQRHLLMERRRLIIGSMMLGMASVSMITGILSIVLLAPKPPATFEAMTVSFSKNPEKVEQHEKRQSNENIWKRPSAPALQISKFIHADELYNVSIPIHETDAQTPSVEIKAGNDFGIAWGNISKLSNREGNDRKQGGNNSNSGDHNSTANHGKNSEGGFVTFFNVKSQANRIAYVIDFSKSMKGHREQLMRSELARSVGQLTDKMEYQLIFFCGFAWVAGDQIKEGKWRDKRSVTITSSDGCEFELIEEDAPYSNNFDIRDKNKAQMPRWVKATHLQREKSCLLVEKTPVADKWGTRWEPGIDMALRMHPRPEVIIFMTDGIDSGAIANADKIAEKAKREGVIINTIAMLQPEAKEAMIRIAEVTGGTYIQIGQDGLPYDQHGRPVKPPAMPADPDQIEQSAPSDLREIPDPVLDAGTGP